MMDEFIHRPKPYILLSTTCDEILSWMIEIWMKNHLINDSNCNTINLLSPNNVGFIFSVGDTIPRFTISTEQTIRIGDTKYHI